MAAVAERVQVMAPAVPIKMVKVKKVNKAAVNQAVKKEVVNKAAVNKAVKAVKGADRAKVELEPVLNKVGLGKVLVVRCVAVEVQTWVLKTVALQGWAMGVMKAELRPTISKNGFKFMRRNKLRRV
ncbi:MAG: hypothetical protein AABZ60_20690 [Planctomycetota bacterium]